MQSTPRASELAEKAAGLGNEAVILVAGVGCRFERKLVRSIRVERGNLVLDVGDVEESVVLEEVARGQG